jgi:hypothetical protein
MQNNTLLQKSSLSFQESSYSKDVMPSAASKVQLEHPRGSVGGRGGHVDLTDLVRAWELGDGRGGCLPSSDFFLLI